MRIDYISPARIHTYLSCGYKYELLYDKKVRVAVDDINTRLGTSIHEVLKTFLEQERRDWQSLQSLYYRAAKNYSYDKFVIGQDMLKSWHSRESFEERVLQLEKSFEVMIEGWKFYGIIDKVQEVDSYIVEVVDYKTGYLDDYELDVIVQLGIYDVVVRRLYPNYQKYILSLDFLRHGKHSFSFSEEQSQDFLRWVLSVAEHIKKSKSGQPRVGRSCVYCNFRSVCKPFREVVSSDVLLKLTDTKDITLVSRAYQQVKGLRRSLEQAEKRLAEIISARLTESGSDTLRAGMFEYFFRVTKSGYYDPYEIGKVLDADELKDVLYVKKTKLDEKMSTFSREKQEALKRMVRFNVSPPQLCSKPISIKSGEDVIKVIKDVGQIVSL